MALPFFPDFGNFIWRRRQGESVNLWRAADHADHQRKWTVPHVAKAQRRSIVPTIAVEDRCLVIADTSQEGSTRCLIQCSLPWLSKRVR